MATRRVVHDKQRWFSGRILACHAGGPGSIPGRCIDFLQKRYTYRCAKNYLYRSEFIAVYWALKFYDHMFRGVNSSVSLSSL